MRVWALAEQISTRMVSVVMIIVYGVLDVCCLKGCKVVNSDEAGQEVGRAHSRYMSQLVSNPKFALPNRLYEVPAACPISRS